MQEEPCVDRRFELDGGELVVSFYRPEKVPGSDFKCRWTIGWPGGAKGHYAYGVDSIQALMLAMRSVHIELVESEAYKSGKLTLFGQADLDLPPTWGAGPLYYIPPPKDAS